jgi:predicted small secreted protein
MEYSMIRNLIAIALLGSSLALAGCNTVRGLGQDVESIGETVEDAAD